MNNVHSLNIVRDVNFYDVRKYIHPDDAKEFASSTVVKVGHVAQAATPTERVWAKVYRVRGNKVVGRITNCIGFVGEETVLSVNDFIEFDKSNIFNVGVA